MDLVIFTTGFSIMLIGLLLIIINIIRKKPLEKYKIIMSIGVVLFFSAVLMEDPKTGKPIQRPRIESIQDEGKAEEEAIENELEEGQDQDNGEEELASDIEEGSIEELDEILEETSSEGLEEKAIQNTELFNEIYYNIAYRQLEHGKDAIIARAKARDFFIEEDEEKNSIIISDGEGDDKYKGDYVYISFENTGEGNMLTSASYHHVNENIEVSFTNYSTDGDSQYDSLKTHIIGEGNEEVETVGEQIEFLNTRKALE